MLFLFVQFLILACALVKMYEFYVGFHADNDIEDRFQFIVFDKKVETIEFRIENHNISITS